MDPDRLEFTLLVTRLLNSWGLNLSEQALILDLPQNTSSRQMRKYNQGTHTLPNDANINERVEHLVGIADALRTTYPTNPMMGRLWLNQANAKFDQLSPLKYMLVNGNQGVIHIRSHLDCSFDWEQDEKL